MTASRPRHALALATIMVLFIGCGSSQSGAGSTCGNGKLDGAEACDPGIAAGAPGACPKSCDDNDPATYDVALGTAEACTRQCLHVKIPTCGAADGFCPPCCSGAQDPDCSTTCGNGTVDPGETCDGNCPTSCDDNNPCTVDTLTGSAQNCTAACSHTAITACAAGDGCCPSGCDAASDSDCAPTPSCGNGVVDPGETCDPPSSCPTSCDDNNPCTADTLTGSAQSCTAACSHTAITTCTAGDGCCPSACNANTDSDCSPSCGNGVVESGETCDPPSSCPTSCDDGDPCTADTLTGSAQSCTAACNHAPITTCSGGPGSAGDGCCPAGCTVANDTDCTCPAGMTLCTSSNGTPYCADEQTDNANCGGCGQVCPAGQVCSAGQCGGTAAPNGASCTAAPDCAGGTCITVLAGLSWPGGYCSQGCGSAGVCTAGGHCALVGGTGVPQCLADCSPTTGCRAGYACSDVDGDGVYECVPAPP